MNPIEYLQKISSIFEFKTILDDLNNEYVLFSNSVLNHVEKIDDRTAFEAVENHVHLIDKVRKKHFNTCVSVAHVIGRVLLESLETQYPQKGFIVYVTIKEHDSMIIRFHQKWENEAPYCDPSMFNPQYEFVAKFESNLK